MTTHAPVSARVQTTDVVVWCAVLLQQIMQLSAAQIEGLPPEQKAQVLALQQQMVSFHTCVALLLYSAWHHLRSDNVYCCT